MKVASLVAGLALATSANAVWTLTENLNTYGVRNINQVFTWQVWTGDNGGVVSYLSAINAVAAGIFKTSLRGGAYFGVNMAPNQPLVQSIRISSKASYNGGLFLFDVGSIPSSCGFWPALWLVGPNWPNGGEIDVIEGVHVTTQNSLSTHTKTGCTQGTTGYSGSFMLGGVNANNCDALATDTQGCGVRSPSQISFGPGFNANGGGVYALEWDATGITTWFFPRNAIPDNVDRLLLVAGTQPDTSGWGTPANYVAPTGCNPSTFFSNMSVVINTDICGTWAGGVWNDDLSYAGQSGSCASRTGYATCAQYMTTAPKLAAGDTNWWHIKAYKVWQKS